MTSFSCLVVVRAYRGVKTLHLLDKARYDASVQQFAEGQQLVMTVEEEGQQRTSLQNRFFHGPVCKAFRALGWADQDTKTELCLRFLPKEHTRPDGAVVIVPGHTSRLTVAEFNVFLEQCIQFAAEHDVHIQDADVWRKTHGAAA